MFRRDWNVDMAGNESRSLRIKVKCLEFSVNVFHDLDIEALPSSVIIAACVELRCIFITASKPRNNANKIIFVTNLYQV
jgi:hypothetical protein